jgi:3-methyl-2-oxobutanoate hydroxymethyltransferase
MNTAVHFEGGASEMSITIHDLMAWKQAGKRFPMLTAYDFPTARILDEAGIPVLLVGDSVGNNVLGYESTLPVTMQDMLHHTKAVSRGVRTAMVVGDRPFGWYQISVADGIRNAARFLQEGGAHAVKVEGPQIELIHKLVELGIPVMAHVGLTPQSVHGMGGYRVQGRGEEASAKLLEQAASLEKAGAFAIVLEGMPADVGTAITAELQIPTIGIGAGPGTDAQVLVINDLLGLSEHEPKFAKAYADLRGTIARAATEFARDVEAGTFPDEEHSYR